MPVVKNEFYPLISKFINMRTIQKILLFFILLFGSSCDKTNLTFVNPQEIKASGSLYSIIQKEHFILFIPNSYHPDNELYLLKGNYVAAPMQTILVNRIVEFADRIEFYQPGSAKLIFSINLDQAATWFGNSLIQVSGEGNLHMFYSDGLPKPDPDVSYISCSCIQNGASSNCKNGGAGSSECSVESNYFIPGGNQVGQKCSVKCGSGHYSCCNK